MSRPIAAPSDVASGHSPEVSSDNATSGGSDGKAPASTYLEQAKDRAQITAATSMSIVHVALLKDTLDAGRDNNPYYTWTLSLIITALAIQIFAGLLALYVALLRNYYKEYKEDFLGDCSKIFCPCKIRRRQRRAYKELEIDPNNNDGEKVPNVSFHIDEEEKGCCPFKCVLNHFDDCDYRVLELFDAWSEKALQADIDYANIEEEIKSLRLFIASGEEAIAKSREDDANTSKTEGVKKRNDDVRKQLEKDKEALRKLERAHQSARTLKTQGDVLRRYVENIGKERVLKRTTFWQNGLNMLLYIVFILNAIIVGFGLTARTSGGGGGDGGNSTSGS